MPGLLALITLLLAVSFVCGSLSITVPRANALAAIQRNAQQPLDRDAIDEAPPSANAEERAKREAKNRRYNNGRRDLTTLASGATYIEEGATAETPLLPTAYYPVIVIAQVASAQPYLSEDRSEVYTEYAVQVEEFLKKDTDKLPMADGKLIVDRRGGVLRQRNGHVIRYYTAFPNIARPLRVGERYVLFLSHNHEGIDLSLGPGFLLQNKQAYILQIQEMLVGERENMPKELSQEEEFLKAVRQAIANPPSPRFYSALR